MSAFKHSAVSSGTSDTPPPEAGRNIGPISLHNAIELNDLEAADVELHLFTSKAHLSAGQIRIVNPLGYDWGGGSRVGGTLSVSHGLPIFRRIRHARCFREAMQATTRPPSI